MPDVHELLHRGIERLGAEQDLESHPLLRARLLDTLGGIHTSLGLYDEARPLLEEALEIRRRLQGDGDPEVADTLVRLGSLAQLSGQGDAVALLRHALAIREAALPDDHPDLAGSREALALLLLERGEAAEAAEVLGRLAVSAEAVYGGHHPELARTLLNLGLARDQLGERAAAGRLFEQALAIAQESLEPGQPFLELARKTLADHCAEVRDHTDAESLEACRRLRL